MKDKWENQSYRKICKLNRLTFSKSSALFVFHFQHFSSCWFRWSCFLRHGSSQSWDITEKQSNATKLILQSHFICKSSTKQFMFLFPKCLLRRWTLLCRHVKIGCIYVLHKQIDHIAGEILYCCGILQMPCIAI